MSELEIGLTHLEGRERIALRGEFDYEASEANAQELGQLLSQRSNVVFDLRGLSFMDSAGLRFLLQVADRHEGALTLEAAQPRIRRLLELTGLTPLFDMRD